MQPLQPGQAALTRYDGKVTLVVCDDEEGFAPFLMPGVAFEMKSVFHVNTINGVAVPLVNVLFRLTQNQQQVIYSAWVNELAPGESGLLESLATQPELQGPG